MRNLIHKIEMKLRWLTRNRKRRKRKGGNKKYFKEEFEHTNFKGKI